MLKGKEKKHLYKQRFRKQPALQVYEIAVFNQSIHYFLTNAQTDLPVLVCLPGLYEVKENLAAFALAFGKKYRVLVIDWLGHGDSSNDELYWTLEGQVSFFEQLCQQLRAKYPIEAFIGQSFGATLLLMHANLVSEEKLVLTNLTHLRTNKTETLYTQMIENGKQSPYIVKTQADFEQLMYLYFSEPTLLKHYDFKTWMKTICEQSEKFELAITSWYEQYSLFFSESFLTHVQAKNTLLMWGMDDPLYDIKKGKIVKWTIPQSKIVFVEQAGHLPLSEQPLQCAKFVEQFLNGEIEQEYSHEH